MTEPPPEEAAKGAGARRGLPPALQPVWDRHGEKIRYLIVGAWNSLFQYCAFAVLYYFLHDHLFSSVILALSYLVSSVNGFICFKFFVFRSAGSPWLEYLRFQLVYGPLLLFSLIALPLMIAYLPWSAYVSQAILAAFSVVVGYLGNKYFTFRQRKGSAS